MLIDSLLLLWPLFERLMLFSPSMLSSLFNKKRKKKQRNLAKAQLRFAKSSVAEVVTGSMNRWWVGKSSLQEFGDVVFPLPNGLKKWLRNGGLRVTNCWMARRKYPWKGNWHIPSSTLESMIFHDFPFPVRWDTRTCDRSLKSTPKMMPTIRSREKKHVPRPIIFGIHVHFRGLVVI